jgi:predicted metal-binding membrane protein
LLKYACLDKCRSPMMFVTERWRGVHPAREALRLGAAHGVYCVGCCWSLMLVMFAAGMSSFGGMLVLGVAMGAEKNFPWGGPPFQIVSPQHFNAGSDTLPVLARALQSLGNSADTQDDILEISLIDIH